ncbi:hypothetical protein [Streptomyces sp. NPDC001635]
MNGQSVIVGTDRVSFISAQRMTASTIRIPDTDNQPMVTIHPDGQLEFGENYDPDEAARAFWGAVKRFAPSPEVGQFGAPLAARINSELACGEEAESLLRSALAVYEDVTCGQVNGHAIGNLAAKIRDFLATESS